MLVFITVGHPVAGILQLQEVRLREIDTSSRQGIGVLLLEGLTNHDVSMVQTKGSVVSQRVLDQGISVFAMSLAKALILLGKIYTVTLNPCRNPSLVVARCSTIRKVDLIVEFMIVALDANHVEQINICRSSTYETVNDGVSGQHLVNEQRVHGGDVTMNGIIVHTIAISVVLVSTGRTNHVIEHPCRGVVSLDGGLHIQHTAEHVTQVTIQTLNILVGVGYSQVVLIGVRVHQTGAELHELDVHGVVHTSSVTLEVRTCAFQGTLLLEVVETYIIGIINTTTAQVNTVVLTDTCLEGLIEPVGVRIVAEMIVTVTTQCVSTRSGNTCVGSSNTEIPAVLFSIHQVVNIRLNLVQTEVSLVVNLQRLVFLTTLGSDDNHTVSCT